MASGYGSCPCISRTKYRRRGIRNSTPRQPPARQRKIVCTGWGSSFRIYSVGSVNTAPDTIDPASPPIPVMITFSSKLERRGNTRADPIARIEIAIAASIPFSPEYAEATVKITHRNSPRPTDLGRQIGKLLRCRNQPLINQPLRERSVGVSGTALTASLPIRDLGVRNSEPLSYPSTSEWGSRQSRLSLSQ